jgi:riboflavin kinase
MVLPKLIFEGTIYSGGGKGRCFMELPWVRRQIREKLVFEVYPGTLNIKLSRESIEKKKLLETSDAMLILPETGYYSGSLFRASISAVDCAVVVPLVPNYATDILEVIAPLYLRDRLGLKDGDTVTVAVTI